MNRTYPKSSASTSDSVTCSCSGDQFQTALQTLAPTSGIERAGDQQLQTMLQTLAPTSSIERAGDQQLQTVRVREGRKNEFHIEVVTVRPK